jgi:hypothetical protein
MPPRPLRNEQDRNDDQHAKNRRGLQIAYGKATLGDRLVKRIGDRGSQRTRQDESGPEQQRAGRLQ